MLRRRTQLIQIMFTKLRRKAFHRQNFRRSAGQRPCLVKRDLLYCGKTLERISFPHQKAMLCRIADRRHDRSRCRKHQRAWAEYNKDRHRTDDLATEKPGQCSRGQCDHHDPGRPAIRNSDDLCLSRIRRLHQPYHPLNGTVFSNFCRLHFKSPKLVDRSGRNFISRLFIHGKRFSGHNRLIHGGLS